MSEAALTLAVLGCALIMAMQLWAAWQLWWRPPPRRRSIPRRYWHIREGGREILSFDADSDEEAWEVVDELARRSMRQPR